MLLIAVPRLDLIASRLPEIFPEGTENRNYVIREMASRAVYVMLYANAIEGSGRWIRPSHIYFMTQEQADNVGEDARNHWFDQSLKPRYRPLGTRWYADNTREPLRDETLRAGFIVCRAVIERDGLPTTSSSPKYALDEGFAKLFDAHLVGEELDAAIEAWRSTHLSKTALARQRLVRHGAAVARDAIRVTFPTGEIRNLAPGPSSVISKAVIEEFAPRFLKRPSVLWLSESGNKVVARDEELARHLGIHIDVSKALPDIILVDLGEFESADDMLVVFVEVVASDGPVNHERKAVLTALAVDAGFEQSHLAFLTAFGDRAASQFKRSISTLAWGSFAWFVCEPTNIVHLRDGNPVFLSKLARIRE